VALIDAMRHLRAKGVLSAIPVRDLVAAVSVGIVQGRPVLDLNYAEDSVADVDMNVVMTGSGAFVELQGTAERCPFPAAQLQRLLRVASQGIRRLMAIQRQALGISSIQRL
jgi:ribonuclease PH